MNNGLTTSLALRPALAATAVCVGCMLAVSGFLWGPARFAWPGAGLAMALAWASLIDIDRFLLPNAITLGLVVAGLCLAALGGPHALLQHAIGAAAGYAALAGLGWLYRRFRGRDGLGLGDAKLLAAAGAWLGWTALPAVLLAASIVGLLFVLADAVARRKIDGGRVVPFGPFIATGFWSVWLAPALAITPSPLFAA
jgi:leader peptidase (prepilin peptidase)/N-methyltransferase